MVDMKQVVLITGCASGIGYLTALKFARNGFTTFASVRDMASEGARELQRIAAAEQISLFVLPLDITKDEEIKEAIQVVMQRSGKIDILINNAGFGYLGAIEDFSIEEIQQQYDTNIFGTLRMIKAVVPLMRERKNGKIINISSVNGLLSFPLFGVYSSSKYALETLSEVLRFELRPFGITVSLVEPGSFLTGFGHNKRHPARHGSGQSPYKALTDHFFSLYDRVQHSKRPWLRKKLDPQKVADAIYHLAQKKHPPLRTVIGTDAKINLFLHRFLPDWMWNRLLRVIYHR